MKKKKAVIEDIKSPEQVKLNIEAKKLNEIKFSIGDKTITVDNNSLISIQNYIDNIMKFNTYWSLIVERYHNFTHAKIDSYLEQQKKNDNFYIGENYADFLDTFNEVYFQQPDNYMAADIIQQKYKKEFGLKEFKKITFRPEASFCHIYTKDKKAAQKFLWWSYEKFIEPKLVELL